MTIATQITRLQTAKGEIKAAIEAKGVTVAPELTLDAYPAKIAEITTGGGGGGGEWTKPADWIDISEVADNEINLLVTEGSGFAFTCTVAVSGTFSVDWGDGTIDHNCASGAVQQHIHTVNGTPWTATGGHTWKVRVYNATAAITTWKIVRHTYTNRRQYSPLLWAVVGAQGLTDCSNMFYNQVGQGVWCTALKAVTIASFASCTNASSMLYNCYGLNSLTLPASWGSVANVSSMLYYCYGLSSLTLPASWGSVANVSSMLYYCYGLSSLTLPASWGSVTNVSSMLNNCYGLSSLTLPASWGSVANVSSMLYNCYGLNSLTLPASWGSVTNVNSMLYNCYGLNSLTLPASWGSVTNVNSMLYGCYGLSSLILPASWGSVTNVSQMLSSCYGLSFLTLPASWGSVSNVSYMLNSCYGLSSLTNFNYLGSTTTAADFTDALRDCENLQTPIVCESRLTKFGAYGAAGYVLKIPSIRLTNAASTFTGSSPHINVSYTSMSAAALENLFTDLPTLTGKTINITGCVGAASLTTTQREIATNKGWTIVG